MTAKDLKNALHQEAIQGKLVPQIASEGNARDLLEEIRIKKVKISGKKYNPKEQEPVKEDEVPFDIPESWCWCRLGELGLYRKGPFGSSLTKSMFVPRSNISVKVYEQKNAIQKDFSLGDYYISKEKFESMQSFIVEPTDIIVSCAGTIGEVYKLPNEAPIGIINQALMRVKLVNEELASFWMMYFDYVLKKEASKQGSGTAIKNIPPFEILKAYPFPLPPLAEQKRIVAAIEKFMPLIEEYAKKETVLNELNANIGTLTKKAILQEAVQGKLVPQIPAEGNAKDLLEQIKAQKAALIKEGKIKKEKPLPEIMEDEIPFDIPENWCWCRLGEIVNYKMGKTPPRAEAEWWGSKKDTPWISIADMNSDGYISKTKETMSPKSIKEVFSNNFSPKGTLIMSFKLTVGRVSILDIDATHNEAIISIFPFIDDNKITRDYLFKLLPLLSLNGDTKDAIKGRTLNSTSLSNMLIPLPPLSEQKRIVTAIEKMLPLCEKLGK